MRDWQLLPGFNRSAVLCCASRHTKTGTTGRWCKWGAPQHEHGVRKSDPKPKPATSEATRRPPNINDLIADRELFALPVDPHRMRPTTSPS